mmetsp:Transcript_22855/g.51781  ORF Transcript_22855/g.51781 Transcript_22855/m.51781 type:complete len:269 (-) Transcript_22855:105-911(-)
MRVRRPSALCPLFYVHTFLAAGITVSRARLSMAEAAKPGKASKGSAPTGKLSGPDAIKLKFELPPCDGSFTEVQVSCMLSRASEGQDGKYSWADNKLDVDRQLWDGRHSGELVRFTATGLQPGKRYVASVRAKPPRVLWEHGGGTGPMCPKQYRPRVRQLKVTVSPKRRTRRPPHLRQALADRLAEAGGPNTAQLKKLCEVLEVGQSGGRVVRWLVGLAKKLQAESVEEEEAEAAQTPPLLPQRSRTRLLPVHGSPHACSRPSTLKTQ